MYQDVDSTGFQQYEAYMQQRENKLKLSLVNK